MELGLKLLSHACSLNTWKIGMDFICSKDLDLLKIGVLYAGQLSENFNSVTFKYRLLVTSLKSSV